MTSTSKQLVSVANGTITLTAKWAVNSFDVTVSAVPSAGGNASITNGTTVVVDGDTKYVYGTDVTVKATLNAGYSFKGWFDNNKGTGTALDSELEYTFEMPANDVTLYAIYEIHSYNLSVVGRYQSAKNATELNTIANIPESGTTLSVSGNGTFEFGKAVTVTASHGNDYVFVGWFSAPECTGTALSTNLTYNFNMPSKETNGATHSVYAYFVQAKVLVTLVSRYQGAKNATELDVIKDSTATLGGTLTIASSFETGDVTDRTGVSGRSTGYIYYNQQATIENSAKTGFKFDKYYNEATCSTEYTLTSGKTGALTADKTIYGRFVPTSATVTATAYFKDAQTATTRSDFKPGTTGGTIEGNFALTAGSNGAYTISVLFGKSIEFTAKNVTGYTFIGWYSNTDFADSHKIATSGNYTVSGAKLTIANITSAVNVYAYFEINEYTISAEAYYQSASNATTLGALTKGEVGGTVSGMGTVLHGQSLTLTASANTSNGFAFAGWFTKSTCLEADRVKVGTENAGAEYSATYNSGTTLYAKFVEQKYTLTLKAMFESATDAITLGDLTEGTEGGTVSGYGSFFASKATAISATAKTGYKFVGWYGAYNSSTKTLSGPITLTDGKYDGLEVGGTTIYAWFQQEKYTLTVNDYYIAPTTATTLANKEMGVTGGTISGNFDLTAGSGDNAGKYTIDVYYGQSVTLTATPKTGYEFTGWYTSSDATGTPSTGTYAFTQNTESAVTMSALFTIKQYTITVKPLQITPSGATTLANDGKPVEGTVGGIVGGGGTAYHGTGRALTATANAGYSFTGWYATYNASTKTVSDPITATSGDNKNSALAVTATSNRTIYALFEVDKYQVTLGVLTRETSNGTISTNANGNTATIASAMNASGTAVSNVASGFAYYSSQITLTATKTSAYSFSGWYKDASAQTQATVTDGKYAVPSENTTLYALFTRNAYNIGATAYYRSAKTFNTLNSATPGTVGGTVLGQTGVAYGENATLTRTKTESGYVFIGWFDSTACSGTPLGTGDTFTVSNVTANKTYYALFVQKAYDVTAQVYGKTSSNSDNLTSGIGGTASITTTKNTDYENNNGYFVGTGFAVSLSQKASTGYTFDGFYVDGTKLDKATFTVVAKDTIIQARFTINSYIITGSPVYQSASGATTLADNILGVNGGTVTGTGTFDYHATEKVTLTANANAGYMFEGWYSDFNIATKALSGKIIEGVSGNTIKVARTENKTVYAHFIPKTYTVANAQQTFDSATINTLSTTASLANVGGTVTGGGNIYHGQGRTLTATANAGYKFVGWFEGATQLTATSVTAKTGYSYKVSDTSITLSNVTADVNIYAKFVEQTVSVTVSGTNTSTSITQTAYTGYGMNGYFKNHNITVTATPDTGYTFNGWWTNDKFTGNAVSQAASYTFNLTGATSLFAKSSINSYLINSAPSYYSAISATELGEIKTDATNVSEADAKAGWVEGFSGSFEYSATETITLTAHAKPGYVFVGWCDFMDLEYNILEGSSDFGTVSGNEITVDKTASRTVRAIFVQDRVKVEFGSRYQSASGATSLNALAYSTTSAGGSLVLAKAFATQNRTDTTVQTNITATTAKVTKYIYYGQQAEFSNSAKANFAFEGYYSNEGCSTSVTLTDGKTVVLQDSASIYARFIPTKVQVTLVSKTLEAEWAGDKDLDLIDSNDTNKIGGKLTLASAFASNGVKDNTALSTLKSGYIYFSQKAQIVNEAYEAFEFVQNGYYTNADCTTAYTVTSGMTGNILSATTIYGKFTRKLVTVTINTHVKEVDPADNTKLQTSYTKLNSALYTSTGIRVTNRGNGDEYSFVDNKDGTYTVQGYYGLTGEKGYIKFQWDAINYDYELASSDFSDSSYTFGSQTQLNMYFNKSLCEVYVTAFYKTPSSETTLNAHTFAPTYVVSTTTKYFYGGSFDLNNCIISMDSNYEIDSFYSGNTIEESQKLSNSIVSYTYHELEYAVLVVPKKYTVTIELGEGETATPSVLTPYKTWTGVVSLPIAHKNDAMMTGYVVKGTTTPISEDTDISTYASNNNWPDEIVLVPQFEALRGGKFELIARTPDSMYGSTVATQSIGSISFGGESTLAKDLSTYTISAQTGYAFVGFYKSTTGLPTTKPTTNANLKYTFAENETGTNITIYAYFVPLASTITLDIYTLNENSVYALGTTGGVVNSVSCAIWRDGDNLGGVTVPLTSTSTTGRYTFTAYYGGEYNFMGSPASFYEVHGWNTTTTTVPPTSAQETGVDINVTPYSASSNVKTIQALFRGKEITISYNAGGVSGATMPANKTVRYGTKVTETLKFNAFIDASHKEHLGFAKVSGATTPTIARSSFKTNATVTYVVNNTNIAISGTTGTLYAVWASPEIWVEYTAGGKVDKEQIPAGFRGTSELDAFGVLKNTITSTTGHTITGISKITILVNMTLDKDYSTFPLPVADFTSEANKTLTFAEGGKLMPVTNLYGLKLTGPFNFSIASGKTMNIGKTGTTTILDVVTANGEATKSIFEVNGGTLVIDNATISNTTTGIDGGFGGIVNATNGANVTIKNSIINNNVSNGKTLFYLNASTMIVENSTIGSVDAPIIPSGATFEGIFYNENGNLTIRGTSETDKTVIYTNGYRLEYTTGTNAQTDVVYTEVYGD